MPRQAVAGALVLVIVGVVLGATVFRTDIAQATGLAGPTVTVVNTTTNPVPVNVTNTAVPTRATDNPALHPFRQTLTKTNDTFEVPDGKRLVIQEVTGIMTADTGDFRPNSGVFRLTVADTRPLFFASDGSAHSTVAGTNSTEYYVTEQATVYAEAGDEVKAFFFVRDLSQDHTFGEMTLVGYLVDV